MTLYLKYRPQKIEELDLDSVRESLGKIVGSGKMPHAFLFSGPRGAGKTSTARILAKIINCEKSASSVQRSASRLEPCNECDQCISITKGNSLDVVEIDAASNRGVDDMRSLRETVKLSPIGAKFKVYIIDEAHMLTTEASNALLKTLEEPPSHAVFILATTESHKLLDTIRSRCTSINFTKGTSKEVVRSLERVVDGEKIKIDKQALLEIARSVDGSFREAHKILEQLSFNSEKISVDSVKKVISGSLASPEKLLEFLGSNDAKRALEEIQTLVDKGVNLRSFTSETVSRLREALLGGLGVREGIREIRGIGESGEIQNLIELFSEAYRQLPTAVIPQLPLEMVVWKWCVEGEEKSHSAHLSSNSASVKNRTESQGSRGDQVADSDPLDSASNREDVRSQTGSFSSVGEGGDEVEKLDDLSTNNPITTSVITHDELEGTWKEIMKQVRSKNTSVEALLRACKPENFDGKTLQVEVFYKFHKDKLEQAAYRDLIEDAATQILGVEKVKMFCILSQEKKRAADIANIIPAPQEDIAEIAEQIFSASSDGKIH